jgi:hypothetical protein
MDWRLSGSGFLTHHYALPDCEGSRSPKAFKIDPITLLDALNTRFTPIGQPVTSSRSSMELINR